MVAVIGVPGSKYHAWATFRGPGARRRAEEWLREQLELLAREYPAAYPQPTRILSDKEAAKIRYADGRRVYLTAREVAEEEAREAAERRRAQATAAVEAELRRLDAVPEYHDLGGKGKSGYVVSVPPRGNSRNPVVTLRGLYFGTIVEHHLPLGTILERLRVLPDGAGAEAVRRSLS